MIYEKTSYTDGINQIYAVGARRSKNAPLVIMAEFKDFDAPGYLASDQSDALLNLLETVREDCI